MAERATGTASRQPRLAGVDAARGIALLGMMAVHVLPPFGPDGTTTAVEAVARGRSAAAFAVLAGVALALAYGGSRPLRGREWAATGCGLLVRCLLIGAIGLWLGGLDTGLAIILGYYALLFALAGPLLALSARTLALLALAACLVTPAVSHLARPYLAADGPDVPRWGDLGEPDRLLTELALTGIYPVLAWTTYLCAGLAAGRLALSSVPVARRLLLGGAALAVGTSLVSAVLVDGAVDAEYLPSNVGPTVFFGTTPTDSWWWLAVDSPHSSTPLDLAHTTGTALALLGAMLLVAPRLGAAITPLAWVGSMTLTLYTAHAVALAYGWGPDDPQQRYVTHVLAAFAVAAGWRFWAPRGPLEQLVSWSSRRTAGLVRGAGSRPRSGVRR